MKRKKRADDEECLELLVQVSSDESTKVVAERLRKAGHLVERELPISGLIGVKCASGDVDRIGRIRGVKFVKIGNSYQLPPFDSSIPQ
jgi:hypothetical protein